MRDLSNITEITSPASSTETLTDDELASLERFLGSRAVVSELSVREQQRHLRALKGIQALATSAGTLGHPDSPTHMLLNQEITARMMTERYLDQHFPLDNAPASEFDQVAD